jgi:hypothetical protein
MSLQGAFLIAKSYSETGEKSWLDQKEERRETSVFFLFSSKLGKLSFRQDLEWSLAASIYANTI